MIIRKSFSKFSNKKTILIGSLSLVLIGSGAAATQASFNDSGNMQITAQSASLYLSTWEMFDSPSFYDVLPNQTYTDVGSLSNWCSCNIETAAAIDMANVKDPAILDATTMTLKIDGVLVYSGKMRNLNSGPIRLPPGGTVPMEISINSNTSVLTKSQSLNSIPIKFQTKSIPSL